MLKLSWYATVISHSNAVEDKDTLAYKTPSIFYFYKNILKILGKSLLIKFPNPPDKYNLQRTVYYYFSFTTQIC